MFYLNMDLSELINLEAGLVPAAQRAMAKAAADLSAQTHAHITERVQARCRSTREKYLEHLDFHEVDPTTWVVELAPGAFFIEEGLPPNFDMIDSLLDDSPRPGTKSGADKGVAKGKTKTAKDGSRYRVIPFEQNKAPTRSTPAQMSLTDTIKTEMKARGMKYGKLETDTMGKPKLGFMGGFNIMDRPVKTTEGPGQGKGPIGSVKQGPTGIPLLQGVRIYQRKVKDKQGRESTKKFIMTFRIVSSKHKGQGRWQHPGLEGRKFFDEAFEWALNEWKTRVGPQVLADVIAGL